MINQITKNFVQILGKQYPVDEFTNVTPRLLDYASRHLFRQPHHPLNLISERIRHFFKDSEFKNDVGYRFEEFYFDSPIVSPDENFDSLLVPKNHVSRSKSDTYYVNSQHLFRSHTSAHQTSCLKKGTKAFISIADCFRRDEIDASHFPVFHQCEVFKLYNRDHVSCGQIYDDASKETETKQAIYKQDASLFAEKMLKSSIERFVRDLFNDQNLQTRWVGAYFPFTHPSFELEILWRDKWLEVLGCGVVRDEILKNAGVRDHIGYAAGFGLERFAMLKYAIPDIRLFWSKDTGFTHQFADKSPFDAIKFKPFSSCPQCINDLSFWLPEGATTYCSNDFYDLCRSIAGELVEQVKLIDEFVHPKTKRTSHCYRIVYRAADRVLSKDEVNLIHNEIAEATKRQFHVDLR